MRSKTCIPQQQFDGATFLTHGLPSPCIYNQVKPLKIFEQINFPKAPLVRRRLHGPTHAHHRRSGRTNIQENGDSKEKSLQILRLKKSSTKPYAFLSLFFWFRSAHHVVLLQQARVERYLSQGGLILKHD